MKIIKNYLLFILVLMSFNQQILAQSYEQKYSEWKAKQEASDNMLNKNSQTASHGNLKSDQYQDGNKIKLNSASVEQLQQLSGVGLKKAEAIIEYRNKNGKFKTIEDIQQVKGIGPALFEKNKAKLAL